MMTRNFSGKRAIVTGAASGLGLAVARRLAEDGAAILGVDRSAKRLAREIAALPSPGGVGHEALICDLADPDAPRQVVEGAFLGGRHADMLVNSAGVCHFRRPSEITAREWDEVLGIDVRSLYFLSVAVAERVDPGRGCRIVNLGSNAGRKGRAFSAHYAAAKAAVANVTESLALAYGPKGITVNTVCPAVVLTPLWDEGFRELSGIAGKSAAELAEGWRAATPLRRLGTPEDVANLVSFLVSDEAGFITGQAINVCGGFMLTC